ncbi:MAG: metal-dependent transcriptional regulator [Longimicrobiales bacterium]|nr:metal-dependent transcriptional regulator [Longimicrobiales bacterium]
MVDPAFALLVFAGFALVAALLLWPRSGLGARWLRLRRLDERVRVEDALKHVYTCERRAQACTLESLAGTLEISVAEAAGLLSRLTQMELVRSTGDVPELTAEGRASALRVVRTHRLWERYLADRTGVPAGEWHDRAERMEHALSAQEADALESRLGHPRWDPHGDPIPTAEGDVPPLRGTALVNVPVGSTVEIVHLEDEPPAIYGLLLTHGMAPGGRLEVVERSERSIRLRGDGREWALDPVAARNVTVRPLPSGTRAREVGDSLADLAPGEAARVVTISSVCQGIQRRRLLDLGVVRGTEITAEFRGAAGDPVAYRIRGALVALRREQASWVLVERPRPGAAEVA